MHLDKNDLLTRLQNGDLENVLQELYEGTEDYLKTHPKAYKVRQAKDILFANRASHSRLKREKTSGTLTNEEARTQENQLILNIKNTIDELDTAFFDFFSNLSKFETMDLTTLTMAVYNFIKPIIASEAGKTIATDLAQAAKGSALEIWKKVKPLFIVEDEETKPLADLKKKPDDKDYEDAFTSALKIILKEDPNLQKEIQAILAKEETQGGGTGHTIINSRNVVIGGITGNSGGVIVGDNNQTNKP